MGDVSNSDDPDGVELRNPGPVDRIAIDFTKAEVIVCNGDRENRFGLGTPDAFRAISRAWLRSGWDNKYVYSFSWLGRPIIQLPDDVMRIQELIFAVQPDVIVETGVAHGGSLVFYATLCKALGKGRVVGVDIEIRPHNRTAIESHFLFPLITLIEGSSVDQAVLSSLKKSIDPSDKVIVLLDSNHTKAHVLAELEAYAPLVTVGSYLVAMDGIMGDLVGAPRADEDWGWNNPRAASLEFVSRHPEFVLEEPPIPFNEGSITERVTYWPDAFLRRVR